MINKIWLVLFLVFGPVSISLAAENKEAGPNAIEVKQDEEMAKRIEEAGKELNNTKWEISLAQITQAEKKDRFTDTLRFKDGKVEVASLASQGFNASGFTISVKGKNTIVWETMQTGEKKGLAFWKGEIEDGKMRGVLSRHIDEKTIKDYAFYSIGKEMITEEAPIAATPAAKASDVNAPPPAKEEKKEAIEEKTKKKKKGKE